MQKELRTEEGTGSVHNNISCHKDPARRVGIAFCVECG